jgi:5-formyltetrahydrofolate cyclo-ligase
MTLSRTDKTALRREGLARRDALPEEARASGAQAIAAQLLELPELAGPLLAARVVAGYWPLRTEVDGRPALEALHARGARIALPFVADPTLVFREWRPGAALARGAFGVHAPGDDEAVLEPDVLLVPLARFDRACHRIGYGKGHYDRALAALETRAPVLAIGIAFSVQEAPRIPAEHHDRRLDLLVTEAEILRALVGADLAWEG